MFTTIPMATSVSLSRVNVEGVRASVGLTFHALRSNGRGEVFGVGEFVAGGHCEVRTCRLVVLGIGHCQRIEAGGELHYLVNLVVLEVGKASQPVATVKLPFL